MVFLKADCTFVISMTVAFKIYMGAFEDLMIITTATNTQHFITYLLDLLFRLIRCSAAVAYPLRGLTCCVFRDALLHTTVVMCGYLCYCHLPVSFDQSGPFSLTSLINRAFFSCRTVAHWLLLVFITIFCKHCWMLHVKITGDSVSEILKPPCLAPTIIPQSKSLKSHFFPILTTNYMNYNKALALAKLKPSRFK